MFPIPQALAEYVGLTLSKLGNETGALLREGVRFASDNFLFVLGALILAALALMFLSGSRH